MRISTSEFYDNGIVIGCWKAVGTFLPGPTVAFLMLLASVANAAPARVIPKPLPEHPGNIFLAGEEVKISLPAGTGAWQLSDYEGAPIGNLLQSGERVSLGNLAPGFYRLQRGSEWISVGVITPLEAPTPLNSPICLDVAMAWFYPIQRMDAVANLCALAGVNVVRDRLNWAEMEPQRGVFSASNKYDASVEAQSRAGLQILQVIHLSPAWANPNGKRFPLDLRDAYRFFEAMARRWTGKVVAFEPWNEADIPMFGGHTGAEMAALQKAAYLGLKSGNSKVIVCQNVFALHNANQLADLAENRAWPYFDTYNLHHYEPFDRYPQLYRDHRAVSAGRSLWVSECALPVKWAGDEARKEPTDASLRVQAERVAKTFASSLYEGSRATFYFLLPHYVEGQTQFGIIRPDLTPRPAYVALAAAGRLLAGARPLGRLNSNDPGLRGFVFAAWPDGRHGEVLVAWTTNESSSLEIPAPPEKIYDHLGRVRPNQATLKLTSAPVFVLLPAGAVSKLDWVPFPASPSGGPERPSPVVLQALWPEASIDLKNSAYQIPSGKTVPMPIYAYNFSSSAARGTLICEHSEGWETQMEREVELGPMERKELSLEIKAASPSASAGRISVAGDFGDSGKTVLSLRLLSMEPDKQKPTFNP